MAQDCFSLVNKDILQFILYEWLDITDVCQLDIACCNHSQRTLYLEALQATNIPLFKTISLDITKNTLSELITWSQRRHIQNLVKDLNINGPFVSETASSSLQNKDYSDELSLIQCLPHLKQLGLGYFCYHNYSLSTLQQLLHSFSKLTSFALRITEIDPSVFFFLSDLPHLNELTFFHSNHPIPTLSFQYLSMLTTLQYLDITAFYAQSGDDFLWLKTLINLTFLDVSYSNINNVGFAGILELPHLRVLDLNCCQEIDFTQESMMKFLNLQALKTLNLSETNVNDCCFTLILQLPSLTKLTLSENKHISSDCLINISQLKQLEYLDLFDTNINDQGLQSIAQIHTLTYLDISYNSEITKEGLSYLTSLSSLQELIYIMPNLSIDEKER